LVIGESICIPCCHHEAEFSRHSAWRRPQRAPGLKRAVSSHMCRSLIVNLQNKYLGLKVANGSEFTAMGINVPDPTNVHPIPGVMTALLSASKNTVVLASSAKKMSGSLAAMEYYYGWSSTKVILNRGKPANSRQHHHRTGGLYRKAGFEMGVSRRVSLVSW
jgi:hypothetical protein